MNAMCAGRRTTGSWRVHDPDLKRLAGLARPVNRIGSDFIRTLDLGRGQPPAFLEEVLEIAKGRAQVLLDMKSSDEGLAWAVLKAVGSAGSSPEVFAGARSLSQMQYMLEKDPAVRQVGLVADYAEIPLWRSRGAYAVRAWEEDLDLPEVENAFASDGPVWVTAGRRSRGEAPGFITKPRLAALERAGAEAVLLNDPHLITGVAVDL